MCMDSTIPLDLTDIRSYLNMRPDDESQDPILTEIAVACTDLLEQYVPFSLRETDRVETERGVCSPDPIRIRLRGPALEVRTVKLNQRDVTDDLDFFVCDEQGPEPTVIVPPFTGCGDVVVEYRSGIYCPSAIATALMMMVKAMYERREEDPLTEGVLAMIRPWTVMNI